MRTSPTTPGPCGSDLESSETLISVFGKWTVHEHQVVPSTNLTASSLSAWHAVRADMQTAGRGRFQRTWVSDQGGLWLSAVVPMAAKSPLARILPLAAGVAVCDVLRGLGVAPLRLRWPNDVLVGERKLAGLLLDQFVPGLAVIGIGINVHNRPEERDLGLVGQVARLAELGRPAPSLTRLMQALLDALESVWSEIQASGPESILPRLNALWDTSRPVVLDLDGRTVRGQFAGVDAAGRLQLGLDGGETRLFEPHEVRLLRELDNHK